MKMGTHEHIVKLVVCATDPLKNSCCIRISTVKVGIVFIREQIVLSRTCIKYPILGKKKIICDIRNISKNIFTLN